MRLLRVFSSTHQIGIDNRHLIDCQGKNMDAKSVIANYASVNENGEIVSFDLEGLDTLIAELRSEAKEIRASQKDVLKKQKEAQKADAAEAGKAFYDSLTIGDEFEILISGKPVRVAKIETKSKTSNSAACKIVNFTDDMGKTPNRYLGFDKVVVPAAEAVA